MTAEEARALNNEFYAKNQLNTDSIFENIAKAARKGKTFYQVDRVR